MVLSYLVFIFITSKPLIMTKPLPQKYSAKYLWLFFALIVPASIARAQKSTTIRAPVKAKTSVVNNKIIIGKGDTNAFETLTNIPTTGKPSIWYSVINVPFIISGSIPKNNISVKLKIISYTPVSPQFLTQTGPSASDNEVILKNQFDGTTKTIYIPVRITFNNPAEMSGEAYIKIDNQESEYYRINFDSPSDKTPPETTATGSKTPLQVKTARVKNAAVSTKPVTLLDSTSTFTLDTVRPNVINSFPVKLYLKLGKRAVGKDTVLNLVVSPIQPLQNLVLPAADQKLQVKIDSADWNDTTDVNVDKTINLQVQQMALVKSEQDLKITLKGVKDNGRHVVKIMPYKTKNKNESDKLIKSGQAEIVLNKTATINREFPSSVNLMDTVMVKVKLIGEYDASHNQLVFAFLDTTASKRFQILENPIEIEKDEWTASQKIDTITNPKTQKVEIIPRGGLMNITLHIRSVVVSDSLKNIQPMELIIKGQKQAFRGSKKIIINSIDNPFWAEVGTNFDLLDKIKTNNFYAGVFGYLKDIARIGGKKGNNNLSFVAGVYESQSVSLGSSLSDGFTYRDGTSSVLDTVNKRNQYKFYTDTGKINVTTSVKSIGIMFSPQLRLTDGKLTDNGFHISASAYIELLWQRVSSTIDYSKTGRNTVNYATSKDSLIRNVPYREKEFNLDYRSHYFGVGAPIYIREDRYTLYINSVFGFTSQRFAVVDQSRPLDLSQYQPNLQNIHQGYNSYLGFAQPKHGWNCFYVFQYRLTEVAYGLTFSGEVRGLFLQGSKPVITLALSKKFDLSALLKPLLAPF